MSLGRVLRAVVAVVLGALLGVGVAVALSRAGWPTFEDGRGLARQLTLSFVLGALTSTASRLGSGAPPPSLAVGAAGGVLALWTAVALRLGLVFPVNASGLDLGLAEAGALPAVVLPIALSLVAAAFSASSVTSRA